MFTGEPQTFGAARPQLASFSLTMGKTQYSSQALGSQARRRSELDRTRLIKYVPRMETEKEHFSWLSQKQLLVERYTKEKWE